MITKTYNITDVGDNGRVSWEGAIGTFDNDFITAGSSSELGWELFLRFNNIDLVRGSIINNAKIHLKSKSSIGTPNLDIQCCDDDNSTQITTFNDEQSRVKTSATVNWNTSFSDDTEYDTPDISSCIQEVINRDDWVSGNSLQFIISDHNVKYPNAGSGSNFFNGYIDSAFNIVLTIGYDTQDYAQII